jgi:hypothetical protein
MDVELTRQEVFFRKSMGVLCIMFLIGAVLFAVIPDHLLRAVNWTGNMFDLQAPVVPSKVTISKEMWETWIDPSGTTPYSDEIRSVPGARIWVGLAVSMMIMITVIAGMNYLNPRKYIGWVPLLLISKGSTSALGLIYFFFFAKYFSSLIMTLTDFPIFLFVLIIWLRARGAQKELAA